MNIETSFESSKSNMSRQVYIRSKLEKELERNLVLKNYFKEVNFIGFEEGLIVMNELVSCIKLSYFQSKDGLDLTNLYKFYSNVLDFIKFIRINQKEKNYSLFNKLKYDVVNQLMEKIKIIVNEPTCSKYVCDYLSGLLKNTLEPFMKNSFYN